MRLRELRSGLRDSGRGVGYRAGENQRGGRHRHGLADPEDRTFFQQVHQSAGNNAQTQSGVRDFAGSDRGLPQLARKNASRGQAVSLSPCAGVAGALRLGGFAGGAFQSAMAPGRARWAQGPVGPTTLLPTGRETAAAEVEARGWIERDVSDPADAGRDDKARVEF